MRKASLSVGIAALAYGSSAIAQSSPLADVPEGRRDDNTDHIAAELREDLLADPGNSDLLRRLAAAEAARGDLPAAQAAIDRAAKIAPNDNDVLLARARVLFWSGRVADARAQLGVVAARDADYPELAELEEAISRSENEGRKLRGGLAISTGISEIEFDRGGSSTWKSIGGTAFARVGSRSTVSGTVDYEERASSDVRLGIRLDRRIGRGDLFVAASLTPHADFREKYNLSVGGELPVAANVDLLFDLRYAEYNANGITTLRPALRFRATPRFSLTAQWINLFQKEGGYRSGFSARTDYALESGGSLYLGAATYPDTEAGITRQVRSAFAGLGVPLTDSLTLRGAVEYDNRHRSYERKAITIGLGWRFGR